MSISNLFPPRSKHPANTTSRMLAVWSLTTGLFALCASLLWVTVWHGSTSRLDATLLTIFIFAGPAFSFVFIQFRKVLHIKPVRIAWLQCVHAICAIIGSYVVLSDDRGAPLLLLGVVLIFGASVLSQRSAQKLSIFSIILLAVAMTWLLTKYPGKYFFWIEADHLFLATSLLVAIDFLTKKFSYLRRRLESDNVDLQRALEKINILAMSDDLTKLPNRRSMSDALEHEQTSLRQNTSEQLSLALLDLDFFKRINDEYGHTAGDEVLRAFAEKMKGTLRTTDVAARWGGEEFLLMMPNTNAETAVGVLERIRQCITEIPLPGFDEVLAITFSAGVSSCMQTDSIWEAITHADKAMYQAKANGRNTICIFDPEIEATHAAQRILRKELESGVRANELVLHYQPQVDSSGRVTGAEALVRWQHPARGLIQPAEFISMAEHTSLIEEIGKWVLNTACKQLQVWSTREATKHFSVAVNVSARQLRNPSFVDQVGSIVLHTGADPTKLKLELTESMLIVDMDETIVKMNRLRDFGVRFSLDDFGTGYSSLFYLKKLPLDQLKIDRSFVKDMLEDANDAVISNTIVILAKSLGLDVIAEGVESNAQRDLLISQGCHNFQGYLFSRPLSIAAFDEFVSAVPGLQVYHPTT